MRSWSSSMFMHSLQSGTFLHYLIVLLVLISVHSVSSFRSDSIFKVKSPSFSLLCLHQSSSSSTHHVVDGVECKEIHLSVAHGKVIVLEATANSQDSLVDRVLEEKDTMEDPYGAVLWPAALSVANYVCQKEIVKGKTVLELGTGTGLVSLAVASLGGAKHVTATDYEQFPLQLVNYVRKVNGIAEDRLETKLFDICNEALPLPQADVVLVADIMYEPPTGRAMAARVLQALHNQSRVIVGDSPGRAGRPAFLKELKRLGINKEFVDIVGETVTGARHELICGPTSTTVSEEPTKLTISLMDLTPNDVTRNL